MKTTVTRAAALAFAFTMMILVTGCEPPSPAGETAASSRNLAPTTPEAVGMSSERLDTAPRGHAGAGG